MPSWTSDRPVPTDAGTNDAAAAARRTGDEWLWGWDPTPGIVSVWADHDGRALVWRRMTETDELVLEQTRFRPWLLLDRLDDLRHLGGRLGQEGTEGALVTYRELDGPGKLRYLVSADDARTLASAVLEGRIAAARNGPSASCAIWARTPCWPCRRRSSTWWRAGERISATCPSIGCTACSSIWRLRVSIPNAIASS